MKLSSAFLKSAAIIFLSAAIFSAPPCGAAAPQGGASLSAAKNSYNYLRIFYYREGKNARASLFAHYDSIDVLAPQSYSLNGYGKLYGRIKPNVLLFAKNRNIKIMPLVTNGNFSRSYRTLLDNPAYQDTAIAALVNEGKKKNYWGWQFDFEQMDASYRDKFSEFIKRAADTFKKNNLVLSVAVIAQTSSDPNDYPNNLWQKIVGVYDYASLARNADFISLMSYDDPYSTGPVVRYEWLKSAVDYALKYIPNEKLSMGVPLYYWQWNDQTGARVGIGGRQGIYNVFKNHKVSVNYDNNLEAAFLTYWHRSKQYTIWYENAASMAKKIELVVNNKLHGFSAWALGLELPSVYRAFEK